MIHTRKNLKIVILSQELPPSKNNGGIGTYSYNLALILSKIGHQVHIITKSSKVLQKKEKNFFIHGINNLCLKQIDEFSKFPTTNRILNYSFLVYEKILDIKKHFGIDIIETPNWDCEGLVCVLNKKAPIVVRLHTPLFKVAETESWRFDKDKKIISELEKIIIKKADGISASTRSIVKTIDNGLKTNIFESFYKIPLGIDIKKIEQWAGHAGHNKIHILFVGRFEKRKGVHILLKAMPIICKKFPQVRFSLVGDDSKKNYAKKIKQRYAFLKDKIKFYGIVDDQKLQELYKNCDIFVAPSLYESFGLIYLEAYQYAKPVIGCNVGGIPEVVQHNKTGLLVKPGNKSDLEKSLIKLIENKKLREELGKNARKALENQFSSKLMAKRTLEFYAKVIDNYQSKYR